MNQALRVSILALPNETVSGHILQINRFCSAGLIEYSTDTMQALRRIRPHIIVMDGACFCLEKLALCQRMQALPAFLHTPIVLCFYEQPAYQAMCSQCRSAGAEPCCCKDSNSLAWCLEAVHARYARHETAQDINQMQWACICAASMLAKSADGRGGHPIRTQFLLQALADAALKRGIYKGMLSPKKNGMMAQAAVFHDIGKMAVPLSILQKPGELTPEEFEIVKTHTTLGRDAILAAQKMMGNTDEQLQYALEIVYCHHERWDGSGYPQGLRGEEIPLSARLMAVADVYDALTSKRVYKAAFSHEDAAEIILRQAGTQFDPQAVELFACLKQTFLDITLCYAAPMDS